MSTTPIGIAHLTLLHCSPPRLVEIAAETGFDFVGLRISPATPGESPYPMAGPDSMLAETCTRLRETGVHVRDVEVFTLDGTTTKQQWEPVLEVGARLGATHLNVIAADEDLPRLTATLAELTEEAAAYNIRPALEPITYRTVHSVPVAADIATRTGSAICLDALHFHRFGGTVEQLRALDPDLLPYVQLCDAPLREPSNLPRPQHMPLGQSTDGSDLQLESRAVRGLPGAGELPLHELVAALPANTPISVEAPAVDLATELGDEEFARRARKAVSPYIGNRLA
ncbi:sugar phosphate isomerase/epimerase family protein [Haloactinomyces albus]|uniref:Sugar phosphate isomerase/epimerase n=1 Tax=Haloactinomyces albus TaxID=1352928 RepID=A0AAE3ZBI8_9ACTN|nr:TIM barrel protein [Haloactinomyces albus]MDR7300202.1 sugar phosphate isomerase/epimerase [Haloactinomyces albus]